MGCSFVSLSQNNGAINVELQFELQTHGELQSEPLQAGGTLRGRDEEKQAETERTLTERSIIWIKRRTRREAPILPKPVHS